MKICKLIIMNMVFVGEWFSRAFTSIMIMERVRTGLSSWRRTWMQICLVDICMMENHWMEVAIIRTIICKMVGTVQCGDIPIRIFFHRYTSRRTQRVRNIRVSSESPRFWKWKWCIGFPIIMVLLFTRVSEIKKWFTSRIPNRMFIIISWMIWRRRWEYWKIMWI